MKQVISGAAGETATFLVAPADFQVALIRLADAAGRALGEDHAIVDIISDAAAFVGQEADQ